MGCDSTVTLNLTIYNSTHNPVFLSTCDSLEWHGTYYSTSGTYPYEYTNEHQCPSADTLHLTILQPTQFDDFVTACDSLVWHDSTYHVSTIDTFRTTNAAGCDSLVILHLTLGAPTGTSDTVTACGFYDWHGAIYTESCTTTYTYPEPNEFGCRQMDTLHLTILPISETVQTFSAECDSLVWNGRTYYESTIDTIVETNAIGCDSLIILNLTVLHPAHTAVTDTACDSYSWNGQIYTQSGDYTYPHLDANNCTQVDTLHLTIHHPTEFVETVTACDSYTWHGTTYTASTTTATFDTLNAVGCDSTVTLHLTINHSTSFVDSQIVCDSLVWHDSTYYQSTIDTFVTTNAAGCDSLVILNLTINNSTTTTVTLTDCDSIVWNGLTYYSNTTLTDTLTSTITGCDSIIVTNLIVNHPDHTAISITECKAYIWNWTGGGDTTITTSGDYLHSHRDANGCLQVDTLHFTLLDPTTYIVSLTRDFCEEGGAILTVESELENYVWSTGETSSTITVYEEGLYSVTASQGDCEQEASYSIEPCERPILLPNAISINSTVEENHVFRIHESHLEFIDDNNFSIYIYNRWGELVFSSTSKYFQWDGKIKGKTYYEATYNYVIHYRTKSGQSRKLTGSVLVL